MFYDVFLSLCKKANIKPSKAAEECGINRSNVSLWKSKGYTPRGDALQALADYFGVSVDYLLGNEEKEKSTGESADGLTDVYFRLAKSFQDDKVDPDDIQLALDTIKRLREKK